MTKYIYFIPTIFLLSTSHCYSQYLRTKATIVFAGNDTLQSEILDTPLETIQDHLDYWNPESQLMTSAHPGEVTSFRFSDGRLFKSVGADSTFSFLQCHIEGYYDLFSKADKHGKIAFYIKHNPDDALLLTETFSEKTVDGSIQRVSNHEFAYTLLKAMSDNVKIAQEIYKAKLTEADITAIVRMYNEFKGTLYPEPDDSKTGYVVLATGILINSSPSFAGALPGIGVSFDFSKYHSYRRVSIRTRVSSTFVPETKDLDKSYFVTEIPVMVCYTYLNRQRLKLNVLVGYDSFFFIETVKGDNQPNRDFWYVPAPYLATGLDYRLGKSKLRFEVSPFPFQLLGGFVF
jgi:hypothetical protein